MKLLDSLEKRFGHLAVPNAVLTLIIAQLVIYAAILIGLVSYGALTLSPRAILAGEWWRVFSFLIAPPYIPVTAFHALFLAFFWYIFWMMSQTLEEVWTVFRFNIFLLVGIFMTVVGAMLGQLISPGMVHQGSTVVLLYISVFLAFATVNPNMQFLVMFILPVKVKWMAWFMAALLFIEFLGAPTLGDRIAILSPVLNYILFFKDALAQSLKSKQRRTKFAAERRVRANEALHTCQQCGATEKTNSDRDFRYKMVDGEAVCICDECRDRP